MRPSGIAEPFTTGATHTLTFFFLTLVTLMGSGVLTPATRSCGAIISSSSASYGANPPLSGVLFLAAAMSDELSIDELSSDDGGVEAGLASRVVAILGVGGVLRTDVYDVWVLRLRRAGTRSPYDQPLVAEI